MKPINIILILIYSIMINLLVIFAYDKYVIKAENRVQKFYTFDSQAVFEQKKNELKDMIFKQGLQPTEDEVVDYLTNIDKIVEYISTRDGATVIVKQAIASKDVLDITDEVLSIYAKEVGGKVKK